MAIRTLKLFELQTPFTYNVHKSEVGALTYTTSLYALPDSFLSAFICWLTIACIVIQIYST